MAQKAPINAKVLAVRSLFKDMIKTKFFVKLSPPLPPESQAARVPAWDLDSFGEVSRRGMNRFWSGQSVAEQLHEHQGLVNVAHPHAPRDGVAQALVGGGGSWGHGGILAVAWAA